MKNILIVKIKNKKIEIHINVLYVIYLDFKKQKINFVAINIRDA